MAYVYKYRFALENYQNYKDKDLSEEELNTTTSTIDSDYSVEEY